MYFRPWNMLPGELTYRLKTLSNLNRPFHSSWKVTKLGYLSATVKWSILQLWRSFDFERFNKKYRKHEHLRWYFRYSLKIRGANWKLNLNWLLKTLFVQIIYSTKFSTSKVALDMHHQYVIASWDNYKITKKRDKPWLEGLLLDTAKV